MSNHNCQQYIYYILIQLILFESNRQFENFLNIIIMGIRESQKCHCHNKCTAFHRNPRKRDWTEKYSVNRQGSSEWEINQRRFHSSPTLSLTTQLQLPACYWKVSEMPSDAMDLISHIDPSADVGWWRRVMTLSDPRDDRRWTRTSPPSNPHLIAGCLLERKEETGNCTLDGQENNAVVCSISVDIGEGIKSSV